MENIFEKKRSAPIFVIQKKFLKDNFIYRNMVPVFVNIEMHSIINIKKSGFLSPILIIDETYNLPSFFIFGGNSRTAAKRAAFRGLRKHIVLLKKILWNTMRMPTDDEVFFAYKKAAAPLFHISLENCFPATKPQITFTYPPSTAPPDEDPFLLLKSLDN